eukprot:3270725-Prymnesium_polylepis.1
MTTSGSTPESLFWTPAPACHVPLSCRTMGPVVSSSKPDMPIDLNSLKLSQRRWRLRYATGLVSPSAAEAPDRRACAPDRRACAPDWRACACARLGWTRVAWNANNGSSPRSASSSSSGSSKRRSQSASSVAASAVGTKTHTMGFALARSAISPRSKVEDFTREETTVKST